MSLYDELANLTPALQRGLVWCTVCGRRQAVDSAQCFRSGWPLCCGYTMTIDSPQKRAALKRRERAAVSASGGPT